MNALRNAAATAAFRTSSRRSPLPLPAAGLPRFSSTSDARQDANGGAHLVQKVNTPSVAAVKPDIPAASPSKSLLSRLISPPSDERRNPLLAALGYYSRESIAMGAGGHLYETLRDRSSSATLALQSKSKSSAPFTLRFEMLSVHVYLTLYRLRQEKGTALESDCTMVMQCIFDLFWTDVRNRMLIQEEGMTLIPSGRWVKECEQMFFGMAVSFDENWNSKSDFKNAVKRNITSVRPNVDPFVDYMYRERNRLDKVPIESILRQKPVWSPHFDPHGKWSK